MLMILILNRLCSYCCLFSMMMMTVVVFFSQMFLLSLSLSMNVCLDDKRCCVIFFCNLLLKWECLVLFEKLCNVVDRQQISLSRHLTIKSPRFPTTRVASINQSHRYRGYWTVNLSLLWKIRWTFFKKKILQLPGTIIIISSQLKFLRVIPPFPKNVR